MFITGVGTAVPPQRYLKKDCWEAFRVSDWFGRLSTRTHALTAAVLLRDNGIEARHLAVDTLADVFQIDPDTLHQRFSTHAPALAQQAAGQAMQRAGIAVDEIDAIVVSTCTGYLCPGLSSYVAELLGLRPDIQAYDLVGQGCAAALPNLRLGYSLLQSERCSHVLSVCVEICSAAMYLEDDPGVMVSACLFGDGAGAAVLSREERPSVRRIAWVDSESLLAPEHREALRFEHKAGMLRNILTREVPALAAEHAHKVLETVLDRAGKRPDAITGWIMHAGGRDVLLALEKKFEVGPHAFRHSADMLRNYGNLSSAFVYFVLSAALDEQAPGGNWWLSSFGAGFSCHGALLDVA